MIDRNVFGAQDDPDAKMTRGVVEQFGGFAGPGGAPGGGVGLDFRRCQDDGGGGEVFDQFGKAALFPDRGGRRAGGGRDVVRSGAAGNGRISGRGAGCRSGGAQGFLKKQVTW